VVRLRRNAVSAPPTMQLSAKMTSAKVSVEPVNGKFVPGDEDVSVVVVVGASVASACTVVGVDVLAVEPKSPIGVVGTVGIDVDVVLLVEVLEVDVLELLEEVGSSPPAQNETWLMVGGCPPPFSGGCNPPPLVAAGSKR
jgi:hypothetical protein